MILSGHRQRLLAALAATVTLAVMLDGGSQRAYAQASDLRDADETAVDGFDDTADADPDAADEEIVPARTFATSGSLTEPVERPRLVRDERGRLTPSEPGTALVAPRPPQQRALAAFPAQAVGTPQANGASTVRSNVRAGPVQSGAITAPQPGPYEPLGLKLGPLRVVTTLEQSIGATSNADFASDGEGSTFSETRFGVTATSDLPLHELRGSLRGSYRKFFENAEDLPTLDAAASFRYDANRDTTLTFDANWSVASESATDDSLLGLTRDVRARPLVQTGQASITAERTGGKLFGRLRGSIGREHYADIEFTDGTSLDQSDREATLFETALRIGYAHTPAFQPFVEGEIGYRLHDEREDRNGQNRDATRYALRVGAQIDLNEKLSGSIAAGLEGVSYESDRLGNLLGPSVEGRLDWSPNRLTRIALVAETQFDDSVTVGLDGTLDYRLGLEATHDLRENLALFGTLSLGLSDPGGDLAETTYAAEGGLTWSLNRALALTGRVNYLRVDSSVPGADYDVKSATIGLRWQN